MSNSIITAVVHDLRRGSSGFEVVLGQPIELISALAQKVVDELSERYDKSSSKAHGRFSTNTVDYPTEANLTAYLRAGKLGFADFTTKLMETLKLQAQRRTNVTSGHVLFAHFRRSGKAYLLVAIVSDRVGAALTQKLELREITHLDLEHFRFAGRIDIDGWTAGAARYIGFLRGKGDVSEYFREFLGCDAITPERQDTIRLVDALSNYAIQTDMEPAARSEFLSKAKTICDRAINQGKELDFKALANELQPADPQPLVEQLSNPDLALIDGFVPHRGALGALVQFKVKTDSWSLAFDRAALLAGDIVFNDDDTLTVQNLPPELIAQLRAERRDAAA
jgi:nucleoid-associated protein